MTIQSDEERSGLNPTQYWIVMVALMSATLAQFLDATIANVAIPHMQASLNASADTVTWVLTSFIVASAIAIPAAGWVAARFGTRLPFLVSLGGFIASSMLCGVATNLGEMVLFRVIQGISAAFIGPIAQAIMLDITPREKQTRALSIWGMTAMLGPIAGPTLGGYLTDNLNWRWVFYINAPIGIPAFIVLLRYLPSSAGTRRRLDLFGYTALALALGSFQFMLDRGAANDWFEDPETIVEAALAIAAMAAFLIHSKFTPEPLFPRAVSLNPKVLTSCVFGAFVSSSMIGVSAILPSMLETLFGLSVMQTGIAMAPRGVGVCLVMFFVPRLLERYSIRAILVTGFAVLSLSMYAMTRWSLHMPHYEFALTALLQGLGIGLLMMPANLLAFAAVPAEMRTDCSGLINLVRNMSGSIAISAFVLIATRTSQAVHSDIASSITPSSLVYAPDSMRDVLAASPVAVQALDTEINRQAAMIGYLNVFTVLLVMALLALALSTLLRGKVRMT